MPVQQTGQAPINADDVVRNINQQQQQFMIDQQKINQANQQLQTTIQNAAAESNARRSAADAMQQLIGNIK